MSKQVFDKFTADTRVKLAEAARRFACSFDPATIEIKFDLKGRTAGMACWRGFPRVYSLRFNAEAVLNYNEDMTDNTIPHEVAHLVCFDQPNLGADHDEGWKRVCRMLGGDDSRCHDYVLTPAKIKPINRYIYNLPNGEEVFVGPKYHNRLQRGETSRLMSRKTGAVILACHWSGKVQDFRQPEPTPQQPTQTPGLNIVHRDVPALSDGMSKKDKAAAIYRANSHLTRAQVIQMFVEHAGLTKAGAGTYYQNFKSGKF